MPAVEGSSSLFKIIKNDGSVKKDRFISHLFQEIDVDSPLMGQGETEKGNAFEPAGIGGNNSFSPSSGKVPEENEISLEDLEEKARIEGFMNGEKAGIEAERKRLQTTFDTFDAAFTELGKLKEAIYADAEKGAVELALAIAEKVVSHEVSVNNNILLSVLKEALKKVIDPEKIKIRINKSDLQFINESGFRISELTDNVQEVILEGDDTISRGGCLIETGFGSIDARIDRQLQAVGDLLRSEIP